MLKRAAPYTLLWKPCTWAMYRPGERYRVSGFRKVKLPLALKDPRGMLMTSVRFALYTFMWGVTLTGTLECVNMLMATGTCTDGTMLSGMETVPLTLKLSL